MTSPEIEEEVLTNLGLTSSQARVYLALARKGPSKVTVIAQTSGINRAHLYQILRSLEELGFVERKLETAAYVAAPLKEVAPFLIKQKQQEISSLEVKINEIAESTVKKEQNPQEKPEFLLTRNKNRTLNRAQKFFEQATSHITIAHTWGRFVQFWQYYDITLENAMKKGVRVQQIVELPENASVRQQLNKEIFRNQHFEIRFVEKIGGNFVIIDDDMLLMSTTVKGGNLGETPFLFSNYEGLLGVMRGYFSLLWKTAHKYNQLSDVARDSLESKEKVEIAN